MMRALVGNSIALDLEFYRNEGGVYPGKPTTTRKIRPNLNPFRRRGPFFPAVLLGDVNGDGHADLLVGKNWNELNVFIGVSGPDLFERNPQKVTAALPDNEENIWLVDFNKDGKQDILMHHPSTTEPHQLMMLIAQ